MTYNEFKEELLKRLDEKSREWELLGDFKIYEDGFTSDEEADVSFIEQTNIKYHNTVSKRLIGDFLRIFNATKQYQLCRFDVKYLYNSEEKYGWDFVWKIIDENLKQSDAMDITDIVNHASDYEYIKERLILRPINFTDNRYELKDSIYKRVGDIALVLYIFISDTKEYGLITTKAKNKFLNDWGKDEEEIFNDALINSNIRAVPRVYNSMEELTNPKYTTGAYMAVDSQIELLDGIFCSTFTTYPNRNGAISFWYPGVQEKLSQMAGGDYYVAFTSVDDFRIHKVGSMNPRHILQNIKGMNKEINAKEDILTRKLYRYHADTKELEQLEL